MHIIIVHNQIKHILKNSLVFVEFDISPPPMDFQGG